MWKKSLVSLIGLFGMALILSSCQAQFPAKPEIVLEKIEGAVKVSAKDITAFSFDSIQASGTIGASSIIVPVPYETVLTLTPTIVVSPGASVSPASGEAQNFTHLVDYTVKAEDGTTKNYTVEVVPAARPAPSDQRSD